MNKFLDQLAQWVRNGPSDDDGTLGWMVGHMLHWRVNATMALTLLPWLVGLWTLENFGGFWAVLATALTASWLHGPQMKVNPKYNVTENY